MLTCFLAARRVDRNAEVAALDRKLAHYRIVGHLGTGGMGEVYLAEDVTLKRMVALKILPPHFAADPERISRFRREAEALATLNHPNVVTVHSVEVATNTDGDDIHFLTMEYVEGNTLGDVLPEQGLSRESFFELAVPLAQALAAAHDKGIVHRDLKPKNVMVGENGVLKVVDFGLATAALPVPPSSGGDGVSQLATESAQQPITRAGAVIGTMPYMSPEQLEGKSVDGRSDVFSLGVVLYEMATGRRPFNDETAASLIADIMSGTPREVDIVRRDLPHHLARIIRRCLEKDPGRRFQTARDVSNELVDLRDEVTGKGTGRESQSVAVLPFANLSPDPENEYFADGLTDELISALSAIRELRVLSRTSTSLFRDAGKSIPTIAQELGVRYVVEGTVRRAGSSVRITAQLIDGRSDAHLWAERYSGTLEDIFDLQESLSRRIVEALEVTLTPQEARPAEARPVPQAYDAYLRGRSYLERVTADGRRRAIEYFNLAIAADSGYAPAHAALATTYLQELALGGVPGPDLARRARAAAERALELDPTTGSAHATLGWLALAQGWDWSGAETATRQAIESEPHDTAALHVYSLLLIALGRLEEAMAVSRRLLELDPLSPLMNTHHAMQYYYARQYDRAIEHANRTMAMDPTYVSVHGALGTIYVQMSRYDDAIAAYENVMALSGTPRETIEAFRDCYDKEGITGFWRWRAKTRPTRDKAVAYAALGEVDEAFAWLERALRENPLGSMNLNVDPSFDPLRSDPRFDALLERISYPKTMPVGDAETA